MYQANGPLDSSSTTIRRTLIEHGLRTVDKDSNKENGPTTVESTIKIITQQHADEKRELQELNAKFSSYLDRFQELENHNSELKAELENLKQKLGLRSNQYHTTLGPELKSLRQAIDNSLRDEILQELLLKRYEHDIYFTQQSIYGLENDMKNRLTFFQQNLNQSIQELEELKIQYDQRENDLVRQRTNLENLFNQYDALQNELVNHRLERLMVENELQTLKEEIAFQIASYQAHHHEILSFNGPVIDLSKFYLNELNNAITSIRQDFEILSQTQLKELEEYYRVKTEQIREIAEENKRKHLLMIENQTKEQTTDSSSITDISNNYNQLKAENTQLEIQLNALIDDLSKIQDEHKTKQNLSDQQLNQLRQDISNQQTYIDTILENNVSLRFELSTYRHLLNSEEQRLNRIEQNQSFKTPSSSTSGIGTTQGYQNQNILNQKPNDYAMEKMAVKKTMNGPIVFDMVDLVNDCVIITYDKTFGKDLPLGNWTIRRQNDKQFELIYKFPSSFVLRPRQTIRILSRRSPLSMKSANDVLIADQIDSWGLGQVMVTRLLDSGNEETATITQTRLKS